MSKKVRELQQQIQNKVTTAKSFMDGDSKDLNKAQELMDEADALQKELDLEVRVEAMSKVTPAGAQGVGNPPVNDTTKAFFKALRTAPTEKIMNEADPATGGLTVPQDIQTQINRWVEAHANLLPLIDVVQVNTLSGSRVYQQRAQHTGLAKVAENGRIPKGMGPKFETQTYNVSKFAGYLAATNELLADSDANIMGVLTEWLGEESVATDNREILALVKAQTPVVLKDLDDVKHELNVTLGLYRSGSRVITNDDGLQWLDTLKNSDGEYLLSKNPQDPMRLQLAAGATVYPVTIVPNAILPTEGSNIPIILGDLREFCRKYDRQLLTLTPSTDATVGTGEDQVSAYEMDLTLIRAIMRADYKVKDATAVVYGQVAVTDA